MVKQLSLYEKLENAAGRDVWRSNAKNSKSIYKVNLKQIVILKGWNVRTDFEGIEELAKDISVNGLIQPLEGVMSPDGKFMLTDGERRYRALKLLVEQQFDFGDEVEVIPSPGKMTGSDLVVRMLSGGIQKSLYKPVEIANGLLRLKTDFNLSHKDIAEKMGMSRQWVDNHIKLAKQPEEVKDKVTSGEIKKTKVLAMVDKVTDVTAGLHKPQVQPGLPASLKTDNKKAEQQGMSMEAAGKLNQMSNTPPATEVSGKDALQGVNFDKENNPQEALVNNIMKNLNKLEPLAKGLNDQAKKDFEDRTGYIRKDLTELKEYYSKIKNKQVK